jgi:lipopolysaccharide transport system ATP-binding protein
VNSTGHPVIEVRHVGKCYRRPPTGSVGSVRRLGEFFARSPHWALQDVSLTVWEGEALGIVGVNGAGKSTLLRMMSGLTPPTRGSITLHDRISGLLTLGENFAPLLSAEENARTAAILAGLTRRQAEQRLPAIAAFAELEHVMDQPLRTFSDGMRLRLAFAVSINIRPRVLLIDEVLAVGDLRFREKCIDRLTELHRQEAVTLILTSHELDQVESLCTRAVWLADGIIAAEGPPAEVTSLYRKSLQPIVAEAGFDESGLLRQGDRRVEITAVRLGVLAGGDPVMLVGEPLTIAFDLVAAEAVTGVAVSISATDEDGVLCFDLSTVADAVSIGPIDGRQSVQLTVSRLDLAPGVYDLEIGVYSPDYAVAHDVHSGGYRFEVAGRPARGVMRPPHDWQQRRPADR